MSNGVENKLDRLIELTEQQNLLLAWLVDDDSVPPATVASRREIEFLAAVRVIDGPIGTADLADRLGWKREINERRARSIARFLAKQLDRRGLVRAWTNDSGRIMVASLKWEEAQQSSELKPLRER